MTMHLLQQIAGSRLPATFYRQDDIDGVRVLRDAGLVVALFMTSTSLRSGSRTPPAAQVLAVTQKGREELARFSYPTAPSPLWRGRMPRIKPRLKASRLPGAPAANAAGRSPARMH